MEKFEIFISWHGNRGNKVAAALRDWLPQIVNAFDPWFSSEIEKGTPWRSAVASRLARAKAGIICLTPSSLTAPWLLFEAGAIAKSEDKAYACTLLIGLKNQEVTEPLSQFQHTAADSKEDVLKLVKTLNNRLGKDKLADAQLEKSFAKWWPELEERLKTLPPDEEAKSPRRDSIEMLAELVELARTTGAQVSELASRSASEFAPELSTTPGAAPHYKSLSALLGLGSNFITTDLAPVTNYSYPMSTERMSPGYVNLWDAHLAGLRKDSGRKARRKLRKRRIPGPPKNKPSGEE